MTTVKVNTVEEQLKGLREEIIQHDRLYEQNSPVITDSEYDRLYLQLVELEDANPELSDSESPTNKIHAVVVDGLKKVTHSSPMLSQEKITDAAGIRKFVGRGQGKVLAQHKMDGLTIVVKYNNGRLEQAVSRGTGLIGEDLTHTISTIKNVPKVISFTSQLEVRMEVIIPYAEFERINTDGKYSNPRNLASGTVRQLDSSVAASRALKGIAFDLVYVDGLDFETDTEQLAFLKENGFELVETFEFDADEVEKIVEFSEAYGEKERGTLPFMIDGLVLKFDTLAIRETLGSASKYPKWACAYKFSSLDATTTLREILFQVGKTGQITPVAVFDEVDIDSVRITRATLHNFRNIRDKDIRIGDRIIVQRANDVIPQVVQSIHSERSGSEIAVVHPEACPACGIPTKFNGENLYCTNAWCEPVVEGKLEHFVSREAMNIDGLGDKTIAELHRQGFINLIPDIYDLHEKGEGIVTLEGFGKKKFDKMVKGIEASKSNSFHQVLYAFSIPNIGRTASRTLAKHFDSVPALIEASKGSSLKETLLAIPDFGETMANSLIEFLCSEANREMIEELSMAGLLMKSDYVAPKTDTAITEKTFVITGALSKGRNEFKAEIEGLGGKVSGSVSKKTDYLLMGPDAEGSSNHKKAVELGVTILSEQEYSSMV
ncbi:NAD-dependent DNA ligase LigA [Psychrobacillus sp. FSL H8-0510]|uniref:NAD-dependent DNA ligase LigA n=1 Tax=Psychrobacillus sp. FSL H8-0510 TaxID=2921394 RepID=UPI0030F93BB2